MASETIAVNKWINSRLSVNEELIEILGEPFNTANQIKRQTNYQLSNALFVPAISNGHTYKVKTAGKTAISEPVFSTITDAFIVDGTVIWQEEGSIGVKPRIFEGVAPLESKEPLIIFNLQSPDSTHRVGQGGTNIFATLLYQIKAIDRGNDKTIAAKIADIIDDELNIGEGEGGYSISFNSKTYIIYGCFRDEMIDYHEVVDEDRFNHVGGLYKILVQVQ